MKSKPSNVVPFAPVPEISINVSHLVEKLNNPVVGSPGPDLDLAGKRKAVLVTGAGSVGKTLFSRWACEKALAADADLQIATCDPVNRELQAYFEDVLQPGSGASPKDWLSMVLTAGMSDTGSLLIDLGGGDTALAELAHEVAGLAQIMQAGGLTPVLVVLLSPRVVDLTPLAALRAFAFVPPTTILVSNLGRGSVPEFDSIRSHSVYRETLTAGAAEIFMPRLFRAEAVEQRRLSFEAAAADDGPLAVFDRHRVRTWLDAMDTAFEPVRSWLP